MAYLCLSSGYGRNSGVEPAVRCMGERGHKDSGKLRKRIRSMGISYDRIGTDDWQSFIRAFLEDNQDVGKEFTVGIERNNCPLRHRIRRVFRRTGCFSKKRGNPWKACNMAFFIAIMDIGDSSVYFVDHRPIPNSTFN